MQIAGGVGFSYLFHVKCDIIRVLVGPTNGWCVNKISSKLLWLLSSLSKGKILNCDYHYWLVREHYIFSCFFFFVAVFFIPLPLCLSFLNLLSFLQRFQLQLLATWGWNSQADIAIDNITFGMDCFADGEPCHVTESRKEFG